MNNLILFGIGIAIFAVVVGAIALKNLRVALVVQDGFAALLYHEGKLLEVLGAGRHVRWGRHFTRQIFDTRKTSLVVAGQEVLTADSVGLKLSLVVTYQIADAAKAARETQNWCSDLYTLAQLALRAVVGGCAVEALLDQG